MAEFAVVEFPEEGSVEVVAKSWLQFTKKDIFCFWPSTNAKSLAKKQRLPDKELWKKYAARIFTYSDSYEKAVSHLNAYCETSNPELEDTDITNVKRKSKPPIWLDEDADVSQSDEENCEPVRKSSRPKVTASTRSSPLTASAPILPSPPALSRTLHPVSSDERHVVKKKVTSKTLPSPFSDDVPLGTVSSVVPTACTVPSEDMTPSMLLTSRRPLVGSVSSAPGSAVPSEDMTPSRPSTSRRSLEFPNAGSLQVAQSVNKNARHTSHTAPCTPPVTQVKNLQSQVLQSLQEIKENQNDQMILLRRVSMLSETGRTSEDFEDMVQKARSVSDMDDLQQRLTDKSFRKKLVSFLSSLGGKTMGDMVRRCMRRMGTNALWSRYSMKGRKKKKAFINHRLADAIMKACKRTFKNVNNSEVEYELGEMLKHAPRQDGGSKHKTSAAERRHDERQDELHDERQDELHDDEDDDNDDDGDNDEEN